MKPPVKKKNYQAPTLSETSRKIKEKLGFVVKDDGKPITTEDLAGSSAEKKLSYFIIFPAKLSEFFSNEISMI